MHIRDSKFASIMSLLLAVALVIMSLPLQAAWQCPDGIPCPSNCPMLHPNKRPIHHALMPCCAHGIMVGCPLCTSSSSIRLGFSSLHKFVLFAHASSCTSSVCVQKPVKHHSFVLTNGIHLYLPAAHHFQIGLRIHPQPLNYINPLLRAISRTYRLSPSRAPPAF